MEPPSLVGGGVDDCRYRRAVATPAAAVCGLLVEVLGDLPGDACEVGRDVCEACCRSHPASPQALNPVVASLVFARASRRADAAPPGRDAERFRQLSDWARGQLEVVFREPLPISRPEPGVGPSLAALVPPPAGRSGPRVRRWAVGVTTAPRVQPTLEPCLDSLTRAGWERPHLFVDVAVRVPERYASLPFTFHQRRAGVWPSYYLALAELLLVDPTADAYMVVQDDALFHDAESLPAYLERVLWPGTSPCLVFLYASRLDSAERPGWSVPPGRARSSPLTVVFPRELAKAFVTDRSVLEHRWDPDESVATTIGDLIPAWAARHSIPIWVPTPSLVQHIGDTSTLWPSARAQGAARSGRFVGDGP